MMTLPKMARHRKQREALSLSSWFQQYYTFQALVNTVTNHCFNSCYRLVRIRAPILQSVALNQVRATLPGQKLIKETLTMILCLL